MSTNTIASRNSILINIDKLVEKHWREVYYPFKHNYKDEQVIPVKDENTADYRRYVYNGHSVVIESLSTSSEGFSVIAYNKVNDKLGNFPNLKTPDIMERNIFEGDFTSSGVNWSSNFQKISNMSANDLSAVLFKYILSMAK